MIDRPLSTYPLGIELWLCEAALGKYMNAHSLLSAAFLTLILRTLNIFTVYKTLMKTISKAESIVIGLM